MDFVTSRKQILESVMRFDSYRESSREQERDFYAERFRLGKKFVVVVGEGRSCFCPSRFAGYADNTMTKHLAFEGKHGGRTTPRISKHLGQPQRSDEWEKAHANLCARLEVVQANKPRTYWVLAVDELPQLEKNIASEDSFDFPDEVSSAETYAEGAVKRVLVNAYERNHRARQACIDHHGVACAACKFDFEERYGDIGLGFIHVHHRMPLALVQQTYDVDPVKDLCPVCPNCHAMLHRSNPPLLVEELKELLEFRRAGQAKNTRQRRKPSE